MNFILSSLLMSNAVSGAVVTETEMATQVVYQQINVLANSNGVPYSTQTVSRSGSAAPTTAAAAADTTSSTPYSSASKHSHTSELNYNYITESAPSSSSSLQVTTSPTGWTSSSSSDAAPAPSTTTSPTYQPAPTTSPTPTTTSTSASSTSSSAPAPTSSSSGGSGGQYNGQATFYEVGLGACGWTNSDSELVAALNWEQWNQFGSESNGNPACNKKATLNYQGKSVTVSIVDKCMGCKYGDLDLSPTAFEKLASESVGRLDMSWSFN